jgi:hypothetical protein
MGRFLSLATGTSTFSSSSSALTAKADGADGVPASPTAAAVEDDANEDDANEDDDANDGDDSWRVPALQEDRWCLCRTDAGTPNRPTTTTAVPAAAAAEEKGEEEETGGEGLKQEQGPPVNAANGSSLTLKSCGVEAMRYSGSMTSHQRRR